MILYGRATQKFPDIYLVTFIINNVWKIQRFYKTYCYFGWNPKSKGIIPWSNCQLPNILVTHLYLCVRILRGCWSGLMREAFYILVWGDSIFCGRRGVILSIWVVKGIIVYDNAKLRMKIKSSNWFIGESEFFWWY